MTEFEEQVAVALRSVPHTDECDYLKDGRCDCDLETRQAVRVAAAIARAAESDGSPFRVLETRRVQRGLAALRGA